MIDLINNYLLRTRLSQITPDDAAQVLGINAKSLRQKFRNLQKEGKLPSHISQYDGRHWIIRNPGIAHVRKLRPISSMQEPQRPICVNHTRNTKILEEILMNEQNFKSAGNVDGLIPHSSGLYCIRIKNASKLPEPFDKILSARKHNILYIGIASGNLHKRFLQQELQAKGHGTFFRSIGAVLGYRPPQGSLNDKKNKKNYKFSKTEEEQIAKWINNNLTVNWIELTEGLDTLETSLIAKYHPLLNLAKNPVALKELSDLRRECVSIANS